MDSASLVAKIRAKIADKGFLARFSVPPCDGFYDPVSGKVYGEPREVEAQALMLSIRAEEVGNGLIERGDARLLLAGEAFEDAPDSRAMARINGARWRIVHSERVGPAGVALLWKLLIRRS